MIVGQNVDALHWQGGYGEPARICAEAGFASVRDALSLAYPLAETKAFEKAIRDRGMRPLRVLCRESFRDDEWRDGRFRDRIEWWLRQLGPEGDWEAGNEPEEGAGRSSSTQQPAQFGKLIVHTRSALGDGAFVISGGLVSGNPWWPESNGLEVILREHCNGFGVHLYEMSPDRGRRELTPFAERALEYWIPEAVKAARALGLPIYVTEIGATRRVFASEELRAEFFQASLQELAPIAAGIWPFGYAEAMVPEYGLRAGYGERGSASWDACSAFAIAHRGGADRTLIEKPNVVRVEELVANTIEEWIEQHPGAEVWSLTRDAELDQVTGEFIEVRKARVGNPDVILEECHSPKSGKTEVWALRPF